MINIGRDLPVPILPESFTDFCFVLLDCSMFLIIKVVYALSVCKKTCNLHYLLVPYISIVFEIFRKLLKN